MVVLVKMTLGVAYWLALTEFKKKNENESESGNVN